MTSIGILSDIHLREEYATEIYETLVAIREDYALNEKIAHTFVLGDLIQDSDPDIDRAHLNELHSIFSDWVSPVTYLLGNHDIGTLSKQEVATILSQEDFRGVTRVDGDPFVYLDSTQPTIADRGKIGTNQREWLRTNLPTDAIVLSHHPLGSFSLSRNVWFENYPERAYPWDRKEVLNIIERNARATVGGHIHQTSQNHSQRVEHFSINAISKETPTNPVSGHYGVLSVDNSITLEMRQID